MPLTADQRATLDRMSVEDVRRQLSYAGPGMGACVPGLADGMILRADALDYLFKREKKSAQARQWRQWVSIGIGVTGLVVAIVALLTR